MTPEEDISGWRSNKNFLKWMTAINPGLSEEDVKLFCLSCSSAGWIRRSKAESMEMTMFFGDNGAGRFETGR